MVPRPWQGEWYVSTTQIGTLVRPQTCQTRHRWRIEGIDKSASPSLHDLGTGTTFYVSSCPTIPFLGSPLRFPPLLSTLFWEGIARAKKPGVLLAIYLGRDLFTARDSVEFRKDTQ